MRIITANGINFEEASHPITTEPSVFEKMRNVNGTVRESIRLTVSATYEKAANAFVNGTPWSITETVTNDDGTEAYRVYDKSDYCIAGDIVDHRDGKITVYMAKPTENEILRENIDTILPIIDDEIALSVPNLFPTFTAGKSYKIGERITYGGVLYKVVQDHTASQEWTPDVSASLFSPVTVGGSGYDEWTQPTGSHDAYNTGARVEYNGKIYESLIDGNVYAPDTYAEGWTVVEE